MVLKYLVLTTMLTKSDINPFDSQETKPYKSDPRIAAMTELVDAYQRDDIHRYEAILQSKGDVLEDPFITENIDEVTRNMRMKAVLKLVAPYTRFALTFIAKQLNIAVAEVQDIVGFLIIDQKLKGKIDQEKGIVEIDSNSNVSRTESMSRWASSVKMLYSTVLDESDGFRFDEPSHSVGPSMGPGLASHLIYDTTKPGGGRVTNGRVRVIGGHKKGVAR